MLIAWRVGATKNCAQTGAAQPIDLIEWVVLRMPDIRTARLAKAPSIAFASQHECRTF
jgi:hypothetical protein